LFSLIAEGIFAIKADYDNKGAWDLEVKSLKLFKHKFKLFQGNQHIKTNIIDIDITYKDGVWHIEIVLFDIFKIDFNIN